MLRWANLIKFTGSLKNKKTKNRKGNSSTHAVEVLATGEEKRLPGTPFICQMLQLVPEPPGSVSTGCLSVCSDADLFFCCFIPVLLLAVHSINALLLN